MPQDFFGEYSFAPRRLVEAAIDRGQELRPLFRCHLILFAQDRDLDLRPFRQIALLVEDDSAAFDVPAQDRHFANDYSRPLYQAPSNPSANFDPYPMTSSIFPPSAAASV